MEQLSGILRSAVQLRLAGFETFSLQPKIFFQLINKICFLAVNNEQNNFFNTSKFMFRETEASKKNIPLINNYFLIRMYALLTSFVSKRQQQQHL